MTLEQEQDGLEPHLKEHHRTTSSSKSSKVLLQSSSLEFLHMPPHEFMKSSSAGDIDSPTSLSLSTSSSISPKSSASTLFTRAQIRLSSKFPKRVQSTLFPVRENKEVNQDRGILGHRGSASVTSLRETARDEEDSEDDRVKMSSVTESIIGYHVPWRYYHRKKVNGFLSLFTGSGKHLRVRLTGRFLFFVKVYSRFRRAASLSS